MVNLNLTKSITTLNVETQTTIKRQIMRLG